MRDNWYQASSYWPSSFALVTTVDESGVTNVAPYQLTMPFDVIGGRALLLISRPDSNTAHNLRRTGIASLNYVECTRSELKRIVTLGYPGQSAQDKVADNPFTLVPSPTPERAPDAERFPPILDEAFQVYECVVDPSQQLGTEGQPPAYFVLRIERILLRQRWAHNIETGAKRMPRMPITFGFRGGEDFWFAQVRRPFRLKTPRDRGPKEEAILYEANRIDPDVQFTREACQRLTGIPKPFVKSALRSMVAQAKDKGVGLIDVDFVEEVNRARQRS
jgi:flavin reductase (DIM6/NTAB) family NADH-FMN oxidoreductase RutF